MFAKHHKTGKVIPKSLIDKLNQAKNFGANFRTINQLYYAMLSLNLYNNNPKNIDVLKTNEELFKRFLSSPFPKNSYFPYNFGHLNNYSAVYYTYMWSSVIAKDMFSKFQQQGIFSRDVATAYRQRVLAGSGLKPSAKLVEDFLGRPYNFDAFKRYLAEEKSFPVF